MIRIVLAALRAHPAQAVAVALLAALAAGTAALLPGYLVGAVEAGTEFAVESAPLAERTVTISRDVQATNIPGGLEQTLAAARTAVERPGLRLVGGLRAPGRLIPGSSTAPDLAAELVYRDDMCAHLDVAGACPTGDRDLLVSSRVARLFQLHPGAEVRYAPGRDNPTVLRVSGVYQIVDPSDHYWGTGTLIHAEPVFVGLDALVAMAAPGLTASAEGVITPALFHQVEPKLTVDELNSELVGLQNAGYAVRSSLEIVGDRVVADRRLIAAGVPVAGAQLLLLCWFALGVAVRHAGVGRRPDVGLLRLRGVPPRRISALAIGRSGLPILAGAVVGTAVAVPLASRFASDPVVHGAEPPVVLDIAGPLVALATVAAALLAVLGSLVVAVAAERRMLREPVVDLLRRIPERRGGWRAGAVELVVAALAVAAAYQVRAVPAGDPRAAGLALFVPVLGALAVALTGTRLLLPILAALGRRAFGTARLSAGLAVLDLARRPGAHRLAALVVVASALLVTAATGWAGAGSARVDRASLELGADRVVTVIADNATHLLNGVRAADPSGRAAMAAVVGRAGTGADGPEVLAVDTSRLAAVAGWPSGSGPERGADPRDLAALLHPPASGAVRLTGQRVELELTAPDVARPTIILSLIDSRGARVFASLGPVPPGRHAVRADTPSCAGDGCRLAEVTLSYPDGVQAPAEPVVLHRLSQLDPDADLVDRAGFADLNRWRPRPGLLKPRLLVTSTDAGLGLRVDLLPELNPERIRAPDPLTIGVADAPLPLPAAAVGASADVRRAGGRPLFLLGGGQVPVRAVPAGAVLPRLRGDGLLVDLEYAERLLFDADGVREVWLGRSAPVDILDRLDEQGLRVVGVASVAAATDRYAGQGSVAVLRLQLAVALAGLLLAAGSVVLVATVDRPGRAAELAALRLQGVSARAVGRSVAGGYAALIGGAGVLGVLAALFARRVAGPGLPAFDDGWAELAPPGSSTVALAILAAGLTTVLAAAVTAAVLPLLRGLAR